jgi:predicted nucleic acid-binding protein
VGFADCAIAAIAKTHGFIVATRNVRDFPGTGVELLNPWTSN